MIVYRRGSLTIDNFTPRPELDTAGRPGQAPGLSAFRSLVVGPRQKAQGIDLERLTPPLAGVFDDPLAGGTEGHVAIVPVDGAGRIDELALMGWANCRGTGQTHPFTQNVLDAVVDVDVR